MHLFYAIFSLIFVLNTIVTESSAQSCKSPPYYGKPNDFPISDALSNTKLIATSANGKLYQVYVENQGGNTSSIFYLLHVWGTPFEMGFAQGLLLKDEIPKFIDAVWRYMESEIENEISFLPAWLQKLIADIGLDAALDWTYYMSRPYTPEYFYDEMKGLANASGADYDTILRIHMIAGLTEGACSMFGVWGSALSSPGSLLQLRALDWDMKGPFRDYPQITIYHPNEGNGHAFVNVGMSGFIGGLTGMSETQLGISEIGATYPDETFGEESRIGLPFIFLLRDILQWDNVLDDAINRMINTRRTCNLILGVGDGKSAQFRGMEYSYSVLYVMDDKNMRPYNDSWHPRIPNMVYWGMDWDCPSFNKVLSDQLKTYDGMITPEVTIANITSVESSGNNHLAIYDLTNSFLYVSFAAAHSNAGPAEAYSRQFTKFDVKALFRETRP